MRFFLGERRPEKKQKKGTVTVACGATGSHAGP
ncbi:hypothetical protein POX_h09610 [Penicillium oxalicum]|nr:hypothetical protein POX_h09610 [Penicillium oxalicum]KAI2785848.1 hypothetical protein POX_h09610 [Penicillium oxalicum]